MSERFGLPTAIFSLKSFGAAMLAMYVALAIGLERPYWAFLTAYIVAQPLAGAVLSKALFRFIGTAVGATVTVVLIPALDNSPELLTLALASWLALCVFVSLLDRTPRSYMFVLAGYSACIIGFPSVEAPSGIFTSAILRVQEIGLGILCGSLVHALVLPGSVARTLIARVEAILRDAEIWSRDTIASVAVPGVDAERARLAQDVTELHLLSVHIPFETSRLAPRVRTIRALQDQLSLLLPLGAAVSDRVAVLRAEPDGMTPPVLTMLAEAQQWLEAPGTDLAERDARAAAIIDRCTALEPEVSADTSWTGLVQVSLLARLAALIGAHRDCRDLLDQMVTHRRRPVTPRVAMLMEGRRNRELHRDPASALRGAIGAFLTVTIGSALWIGSGWKDGAGAVTLAGVFLALFSASDDVIAPLKAFLIGTTLAAFLGLLYGFVILPRIDGFAMLTAALAPALLVCGAVMTSPRYGVVALATLLGIGSPSLLSDHYVADFASFVNGEIGQVVGIWFAIIMARLLQSAGVEGAIRRTVRAGWADIAARANLQSAPDVRGWINRMLDRVAVLAPRLAARGEATGQPLYDALRDMRTGVAIGELRQLRLELPADETPAITAVLGDVGDYYRRLDPASPAPAGPRLLDHIDRAIASFSHNASPAVRRSAVLALVSLRRNLFPAADAYRQVAA